MHLDENELLYKLWVARSLRPSKNYWALQILQDNLDISDEEMRNKSKTEFQKILQSRIKENAANYLIKLLKQNKTSENKWQVFDC